MSTEEIQAPEDVQIEMASDVSSYSRPPNMACPDGEVLEVAPAEVAAADSSAGFLFKVPGAQRRENPEAYEPELFFFGPYQYAASASNSARAAACLDGEHLKQRAAEAMLREGQLQALALKIQGQYSEIKAMYPQITLQQWSAISSGEELPRFAQRLAMDAVLVVKALDILNRIVRPSFGAAPAQRNLGAFFSVPIACTLWSDPLLLENQVPLSVLRDAFESLKAPDNCESFEEAVVRKYCSSVWRVLFNIHAVPNCWRPDRGNSSDCLLGAVYDSLSPPTDDKSLQRQCYESDPYSCLQTASHLARCGIRCRVLKQPRADKRAAGLLSWINYSTELEIMEPGGPMSTASSTGLRFIRFNETERAIELPQITVGDDTVRLLHNLLAYEASCRLPKQCFAVSYITIMDLLIDTEEDVKILVEAGVIRNGLGSPAELAAAWNKLGKSLHSGFTSEDYQTLMQIRRAVANSRCPRWIAGFKLTYWEKKPWLIVSILAAVTLLVLTALQTTFTMKKPRTN